MTWHWKFGFWDRFSHCTSLCISFFFPYNSRIQFRTNVSYRVLSDEEFQVLIKFSLWGKEMQYSVPGIWDALSCGNEEFYYLGHRVMQTPRNQEANLATCLTFVSIWLILLSFETAVEFHGATRSFMAKMEFLNTLYKIWDFHCSHYENCSLVGYKNPVRTSQETHYVSATEASRLMLCKIWGFSRRWL
jgi:hypothetical protein